MTAVALLAWLGAVGVPVTPREVVLALPEGSVAATWAAGVLAKQCSVPLRCGVSEVPTQPAIRAGLSGDPLVAGQVPAGLEGAGDEAFAWTVDPGGGAVIAARTEAGLTYGLLELADRLHSGDSVAETFLSAPLVAVRGDCIDLPFYLGCDLYDGRWRHHAATEGKADSWFHDRAAWRARFELAARRRMNAIMFGHPHPFPAFITYPQAPEAAYFDDETVARNAETLRWLISEGARFGVRFYFLTWNEWVTPGFAKTKGIPQEGPGTAESAELNRYSYAEFFSRFPGLGGLITMAAESPPGCTRFVRDNVVAPLAKIPNPPPITFWTWCSYPEDVNYVLEGYPGPTQIMHYIQYEQLFKARIDPRVGRMSAACGGRPVLTIGGLGTATGQLYWGDPYVIRDMMRDVPAQHVGGVFFSGLDSWSWVSDKWIGWEALARYWWDPNREGPEEDAHWARRIADVLGDPGFSAPLFSAYRHASAVPMRLLCLLHSQSDVFRPQYGLPLVFYLGMPTLSTYVFENHTHIDEQGRLAPRMGLTWPNPDWGERVVGIRDWVDAERRGERAEGTTPGDIAREMVENADAIATAAGKLQPLRERCAWGAKRFDNLVGVLRMNELLARHTDAKIRAATAWERWRRGLGDADAVLPPLDDSLRWFAEYAELAARLYPGAYGQVRLNYLTKPPPWTNLDLWQNYRFVPDFTWSGMVSKLRRERELIAAALAEGRSELPYEDDLGEPIVGRTIAGFRDDGAFGGLKVNHFPPKATAVARGGGLDCELRGTGGDFYFPFQTDPAVCPLEKGRAYEFVLRYAITRVGAESPLQLQMGARTTEGTWHKDVGARYFSGPPGTTGEIRTQFAPAEYDDYYIYLSLNGDGAIRVENVRLIEGPPAH